MNGTIPFRVPADLAAEIAAGSVSRFGTLLKDNATGRILGHVQETGLARQILGNGPLSLTSPVSSLLSLGPSVYANVQLNQLTAMVGALQQLQIVTLGVAAVGIGVSVAGFALMNKKLNRIKESIDALSVRIDEHFQRLVIASLREHYSRANGLMQQAEQAFSLRSPSSEWRRVAGLLADESAYFQGELSYLLGSDVFDDDLFSNLFHSLAMCNSGRIECMMLANELEYACRVAKDSSRDLNQLCDGMIPSELADKSLPLTGGESSTPRDWNRIQRSNMKSLVNAVREAQDVAATKPYLIKTLLDNEIDGRRYLEDLRNETSESIVLLSAT